MSKKGEYIEKLDTAIENLKLSLEELKTKADKAGDKTKSTYENEMLKLRGKLNLAEAKTNELRNAADDAWEDLKGGVEKAWDDLGKSLTSSLERFK